MPLPSTNQHLSAQAGGTQTADWSTYFEADIQAKAVIAAAVAKAEKEAEIMLRTYVQSPTPNPEKNYDNRLHLRLDCGKTKAYELLKAYEEGKEWGLRHVRIGNKYIVTEKAVQEWQESFGMQVSHRKAA